MPLKILGYFSLIIIVSIPTFSQNRKKIYIANDDHTDYMWTADEKTYQDVFLETIDYYLDLADQTQNEVTEHQSRWNCDGSFWMWTYEKNKSKTEFDRFINSIKSGHISVPLNPLAILYGGTPAEAVIRGMYYSGYIERKYNIRFKLAYSMENQTFPYGISSLWAGAGAKYSWKGICDCRSKLLSPGNREYEMYWDEGPDSSKILFKWYSIFPGYNLGTYFEADDPEGVIDFMADDPSFYSKNKYNIVGAFGNGGDSLKTLTDKFVQVAKSKTDSSKLVVVSNEEDFFDEFEKQYGSTLPTVSAAYGNEWDLYCASMAEVSADVKRSVEKIRPAEALATLVSLKNKTFMDSKKDERALAWMDLGLYWEHDWTADGIVSVDARANWQRKIANEIANYVDNLFEDSKSSLGSMIEKSGNNERFYVFNPLNWERNDYADYEYSGTDSIRVIDLNTNNEVPFQIVNINAKDYLKILAKNVPPVGYKVFEIRLGRGENFEDAVTISDNILENDKYKVTISNSGAILSLIDKTQNNKEFVQEINGRSLNDLGTGSGNISVENPGPVSFTLKVNSTAPLNHISRITLFKDIDRIEIKNEITQNFSDVYTWGFGFNISSPEIWHEEVGAVIKAKLLEQGGQYSPVNARYDWLTLNHFADINNGNLGITLSNADCYFMKIGNSDENNLDINTPLISVLVGGQVDGDGLGIPNQGGDNYFLQRFALQTHAEYSTISAMKFAMEHQNPMITSQVLGGNDYPENTYSLTTINNPDVLLWALKPSEEGIENGIIVRLWNLSDNNQSFNLSLNSKIIKSAKITSSIETPIEDANFNGNSLNGNIHSRQIKTYLINPIESTVGLKNNNIDTKRSSKDYILYQNYPNPFNSIAKIQFVIPEKNKVVIKIYNVLGQEIKQIFNQVADKGFHEIQFNAGELPSGIYFYKMETGKFSDVKKLILLK